MTKEKVSLKKLLNDRIDSLVSERGKLQVQLYELEEKRRKFNKECILWRDENSYRQNQKVREKIVEDTITKVVEHTKSYTSTPYQLQGESVVTAYNNYLGSCIAQEENKLIQRSNYEQATLKAFKLESYRLREQVKQITKEIKNTIDLLNCIFLFKKEEYAIWRGDE